MVLKNLILPGNVLFLICFMALSLWASEIPSDTSATTQQMSALLQRMHSQANPQDNIYMSKERATALKKLIPQIKEPKDFVQTQYLYGSALLHSGQEAEAIQEFIKLRFLIEQYYATNLIQQYVPQAQMLLGTTYLRVGERENCLLNHTLDSCLMPIQDSGVHQSTFGSAAAQDIFVDVLQNNSNRLDAMWLLNVASMTLGEYPDQVPEAWRIPESYFQSAYDIQRFPDMAGMVGVDVDDNSGGGVMDDFDGDGYLDLMVSAWGPEGQLRFLANRGDGTFEDRTREAGLTGLVGGLNLIHADYDNDGLLDVLVLRGAWLGEQGKHPNSLLRNLGQGRFSDVTQESGLLTFHPTQTACWLDYDNDGWLDLFIGNESTQTAPDHGSELFHNNKDGTFTEIAEAAGVKIHGMIKGVTSGDYDNDGRLDIYISFLGQPNQLLHNEGPDPAQPDSPLSWRFKEVATIAGVGEPIESFPTWFWDYDNDGWLDLFVAGYHIDSIGDLMAEATARPHHAEHPRLYRNRGNGTFEDVTATVGLNRILHAMGVNYGDLDNDGWLDFYLGTGDPEFKSLMPNRMFRNDQGIAFQDVTTSGGFGHLQKGHGISFGDIDEDGDQDVHAVMGGAYPADHYRNALFRNPGHHHHWLKLKLQGVESNRDAIGARIKVTITTPSGLRTIHRAVSSGGSFGGNPLRQEIGLGNAEKIVAVEIKWPGSGKAQRFTNLSLDQFYRITEGKDAAEVLHLTPFQLGQETMAASQGHHHH